MIYFEYMLAMLSEEGKAYSVRGVVGAESLPSAATYIHDHYEGEGYIIVSSFITFYDAELDNENFWEKEGGLLN